jgi:hypothetical protein
MRRTPLVGDRPSTAVSCLIGGFTAVTAPVTPLRPLRFHDTEMNADRDRSIRPERLRSPWGRAGAAIVLAAFGLLAAAVFGLSGPAGAHPPTTTLVRGRPPSPPPKNVWIALGGDPLSASLARARRFVACARRNGIPNLPNPKVGGGQVWLLLPPGLNRNSSRVSAAQRACRSLLPHPTTTRNGPRPALTVPHP